MIFTPMNIILITPALPKSRAGNRVTAVRWKNILLELGHKVDVRSKFDNKSQLTSKYDLMIALHAWRSAEAINHFKKQFPHKPLIEVHVIYQSADKIKRNIKKNKKYFDVCVVGHLREEKDPLRAAYAARKLPCNSKIRIKQFGKAYSPTWEKRAKNEMQINPRYQWYKEVPHWKINQLYATADVMVLSSKMEGGANVISEACVAGLPVIASKIDGTIGLLGKTYPGYYPYANTEKLKQLLLNAEQNPLFLNSLTKNCKAKANLFTYAKEKNNMKKLLFKL